MVGLLQIEEECSEIAQTSVLIYQTTYLVYCRRNESSATPLWEPEITPLRC